MLSRVSTESISSYVRDVVDATIELPSATFERRRKARLPGLEILASDSGGALGDAIETKFVAPHDTGGMAAKHLQVFIAHPGLAGVRPPAHWSDELFFPHLVDKALGENGLHAAYFGELDHWHLYDGRKGIAVQLMRKAGAYPPWEEGAPLRPFLHWHYAERGMRLAHAGTLGVDGHGVLLAGEGGSGKSGTVIAGLLHGLQSVGDDYVLLDLNNGVVARPVFASVKQDPEGYRRLRLAEICPIPGPLNWQGKHELRLPELSRLPIPNELRIEALLLPRISAGETRVDPVARKEAMMAIAASSIYQMPGERESGFRFFGELTRQLPCFRLELGEDPKAIAETLSEFICRRLS